MACSDETLQEGASGECVTELQTLLTQLKLLMKDVDGTFDGLTKEAVRDFQGMEGLETNGVVDPDLWARLYYAAGFQQP
jgi:peptidoglycan hydrolase-like protein with peptidoglycan-binding domain